MGLVFPISTAEKEELSTHYIVSDCVRLREYQVERAGH